MDMTGTFSDLFTFGTGTPKLVTAGSWNDSSGAKELFL